MTAWAVVGAVLLVGCGGEADEGTSSSAADTASTSQVATGDPGGSATEDRPEVEPDTVNVRLTEYRIQMPRTLPPGPTLFRVTNSGAVEHNFEIEGEGPTGLREKFGRDLHPTQTRNLQVTLEPGKYKIFCPVGGHQRRGGVLILEVSEDSLPSSPDG